MNTETALRVARLDGKGALLVSRRPGARVHVFTWTKGEQLPVTPGMALRRGARPVCGSDGLRWYLALSVDADVELCTTCDSVVRARMPHASVSAVPDAELPALIDGCRTQRHLDRVRGQLIRPWRPSLVALFGRARRRVEWAPTVRAREARWQQYSDALEEAGRC